MIIDIERIAPEGLRFDEALHLEDLDSETNGQVSVRAARVAGDLSRENRGAELLARLEASLEMDCCRCLERFEVELDQEFRLILTATDPESETGETEMDPERALFYHADGGKAELAGIAREQIYLGLPLKPVCRSGCRGLCPACGGNLNRIKCGCRSDEVDPRLAPLLQFRKPDGTDS